MPLIDLTDHIVAANGTWTDPTQDRNLFDFARADTMSPSRLMLRWAGDFVALAGPLAIRVTVQAENMTVPLALVGNFAPDETGSRGLEEPMADTLSKTKQETTAEIVTSERTLDRLRKRRALGLQASTIYSYTLEIPAGQAWPFSLSEQLEALRMRYQGDWRSDRLGNNLGYRVIIEPAFAIAKLVSVTSGADLPCDFAVADHPDTASFFPVTCEPCEGKVIGLPPNGAVTLVTPPADGGCVRTRFFNGMFITREDLETEQRYHRLKSKLHNRAAGAGVVWGLRVGKQGSSICILPGYGRDCCGNDVVLTTIYEVPIAALLADPAAGSCARQRGPQRMELLLEYIECPSDPRPVHGDPCSPETTRCEMSRVRESVRLRLVPPRDCDASIMSRPISKFLNEVSELRKRNPLHEETIDHTAWERAPFQLKVSVTDERASEKSAMIRPATAAEENRAQLRDMLKAFEEAGPISQISLDVIFDPLWAFAGGTLRRKASFAGHEPSCANAFDPEVLSLANFASLERPMSITLPPEVITGQMTFEFEAWQAQTMFAGPDDAVPTGNITFVLPFGDRRIGHANLEAVIKSGELDLGSAPCSGEPCEPWGWFSQSDGDCDPSGKRKLGIDKRDETPLLSRWLHRDPMRKSGAADPKVLMLAALGGWLSQMLVRERSGKVKEVVSAQRKLAQRIYRIAWMLLFGLVERTGRVALGGTLKRLLETWCDELLWIGPQCCGEPHGVVVGCAVVEGGTIQRVDPFGGRRYVLHYPLLAYWGAQFGLTPPDITLSRTFSKLCCLAGLPEIATGDRHGPVEFCSLGHSYVVLGEPRQIESKLEEQKISIVSRRRVGLPEMIASALTMGASGPPSKQEYKALVLADFVEDHTVMLLVPA